MTCRLPVTEKYEIKVAKNGSKIPVVNDVHLHSIYDPQREAKQLVERQSSHWNNKRDVLIFGLGFGYHVRSVIEMLEQKPGSFNIIVIEPNIKVAADCVEMGLVDTKKVYLCSGYTPQDIYTNRDLIDFLLRKPAMFSHPPSFNLYSEYFKKMLSYQAPKELEFISRQFQSAELRSLFGSFDQSLTLNEMAKRLTTNHSKKSEKDFLIMAYHEMVKKSLSLTDEVTK